MIVSINGDMHIREFTEWRNNHYQIHGNLVLEKNGVLIVDHSIIELMNTYSREFNFIWQGGILISRDSILGGTIRNGMICQTNFMLTQGQWYATDTTIRYCYGIMFDESGEHVGKLRAIRLVQGMNPDSIIMTGCGDAILKDSTYMISLFVPADSGGPAEFDFPVDAPITQVFDHTITPSIRYRLELVNVRVPLWFLFIEKVVMNAPQLEVTICRCPRLILAIRGINLKGTVNFPAPWPQQEDHEERSFMVGNVTFKKAPGPDSIGCWAVYLTGSDTDFIMTGPTMIAELELHDGKAALIGSHGTYDAHTTATTIEATGTAQLFMKNVSIGRFTKDDPIKGQITAHNNSCITIEHATCADLMLITKEKGTIALQEIIQQGEISVKQEGGPIQPHTRSSSSLAHPRLNI